MQLSDSASAQAFAIASRGGSWQRARVGARPAIADACGRVIRRRFRTRPTLALIRRSWPLTSLSAVARSRRQLQFDRLWLRLAAPVTKAGGKRENDLGARS